MKIRYFSAVLVFFLALPALLTAQATITFNFKNVDNPEVRKPTIGVVSLETNYYDKQTADNGTLTMTLGQGTYRMSFAAGGLRPTETMITVDRKYDDPLEADVYLEKWNFDPGVNMFFAIGNFNDFSTNDAIQLERRGESSVFEGTLPVTNDTLIYQIATRTLDVHFVNGTEYESLRLDDDLSYLSVIPSEKESVDITFDLNAYPGNSRADIVFDDEDNSVARTARYGLNIEGDLRSFEEEGLTAAREQKPSVEFDVQEGVRKAYTDFKTIDDPNVKELAVYRIMNVAANYSNDTHSAVLTDVFDHLTQNSLVWTLEPSSLFMFDQAGVDADKLQLFAKGLQSNDNENIQQIAIFYLLSSYYDQGDMESASIYFDEITTKHPQSQYASYAKQYYNPNQAIIPGKPAPDFEISSLDESTTYTLKDFEGSYVMLDFWATWCGPCIKEMGDLHQAYSEFKDDNFTMLSLSFDEDRQTVNEFRDSKYSMPWKHAFVEQGFNNQLAQDYEVTGIPKPILIGPNGEIVAVGTQLRGEQLEETLRKILR